MAKQQSIKYLLLILLIAVLVIPSVASAIWWNPFSWSIWNNFYQKQASPTPTVCPMYCLQNMLCGENGKNYCNECLAKSAGTTVAHEGTCATPIVGGDKGSHGCIGSAGYTWCATKNKCLRIWEEKCPTTPTINYFTIKEANLKFQISADIKDLTYKFSADSDGTKYIAFTTKSLLKADSSCGPSSIGTIEISATAPDEATPRNLENLIFKETNLYIYLYHPQAVCANSQDNKKAIQLQGDQTNSLSAALKTIGR